MQNLLSKEQKEQFEKIEEIFTTYSNKCVLLTNNFSYSEVNKDERNDLANEVINFLHLTKQKFQDNWCLVELQNEIIQFLENKVKEFGGNKETLIEDFKKFKTEQINKELKPE